MPNNYIIDQNFSHRGCWAEFRHHHGIPGPQKFNGEIQVQYWDWGGMVDPVIPYIWYEKNDTSGTAISLDSPYKFQNKFSNGFNIDQSIFTLHSPDIEFDESLINVDLSNIKMRIIGYVPVVANSGDIDITAGAVGNYKYYFAKCDSSENKILEQIIDGSTHPSGFYKEKVGEKIFFNGSAGWMSLINGPYWQDKIYGTTVGRVPGSHIQGVNHPLSHIAEYIKFGYVTYPWQQSGSLANDHSNNNSTLQQKIISNIKYSYDTVYFSASDHYTTGFWTSMYDNGQMKGGADWTGTLVYPTGLSGVKLVNDNAGIVMLRNPFSHDRPQISYQSWMDKIVISGFEWNPKAIISRKRATDSSILEVDYPHDYPIAGYVDYVPHNSNDYPTSVQFTATQYFDQSGDYYDYWYGLSWYNTLPKIFPLTSQWQVNNSTETRRGVSMRYKSSPHIVMALSGTKYRGILYQRCLPVPYAELWDYNQQIYRLKPINPISDNIHGHMICYNLAGDHSYYFDTKYNDSNGKIRGCRSYYVDQATFGKDNQQSGGAFLTEKHGFYWLAELYRDNVANRFGGDTEEALANNVWHVAGPAVDIQPDTTMSIDCLGGDTFYQRYDHLKTYPYAQDDENQVIEIVSFMCESRVNTDGRYDLMRGLENNNNISPESFNSINKAYSQLDNYITGSYIKNTDLRTVKFPNTIIWSDQKFNGEQIDKWTQILTVNSLDLDGDKGRLRALKEYAGTLWGFQDKAIAEILFNPNIAISATDGSPIELASSGKVEGKRYKFNNVGCSNKWSICETPIGLFFNDDINKNLMVFGEFPQNLSDKMGMSTWAKKVLDSKRDWNDEEWNNMTVQYDRKNRDVLYITSKECLAYSTLLNAFTSFYSYENTPYFINTNNDTLGIRRFAIDGHDFSSLWQQNLGPYGNFFGERQPFYTTFIVNDNPTTDKVFNTLEYRADYFHMDGSYDNSKTFTRLFTWNEYQNNGGTGTLVAPNVQKKFRTWRMQLPRDKNKPLDRMRNPWQYIKIQQDAAWEGKVQIHDFAVHYTE